MYSSIASSWLFWAVLSAVFAALTAVFAKVGVENINSDFATFIRAIIILIVTGLLVSGRQQWQSLASVSTKTYLFLVFSGIATGISWLCYFRALQLGNASQVAPIDKMSVVLIAVFGALFLREQLSGFNWLGVVLMAIGAILVAVK